MQGGRGEDHAERVGANGGRRKNPQGRGNGDQEGGGHGEGEFQGGAMQQGKQQGSAGQKREG